MGRLIEFPTAYLDNGADVDFGGLEFGLKQLSSSLKRPDRMRREGGPVVVTPVEQLRVGRLDSGTIPKPCS